MAEEEVSEKISLHSLDDSEDKPPPKHLTWREKLSVWMSTNKVQYTIIVLVVLDSLIVIFELLIDMEIIVIPEPEHHDTAGHNSSLHATTNNSHFNHHHHHHGHNNSLLMHTTTTTTTTTTTLSHQQQHNITDEANEGDVHHAPNKHLTEHILHMASLTILSIFLVEVILKVLAEGKHLLKHKAEVFDAVVVVVSFTMDITFSFVSVSKATQDYTGLLVLLRLWRVTRIINGVILSVKMDADKKLNAQKALRAKAERQVQRLTDKLDRLTRENEKLRARLAALESKSGSRPGSGTTPQDEQPPNNRVSRSTSASTPQDEKKLSARDSSSSLTNPPGNVEGANNQRNGRRKSPTSPPGQTIIFRESGGCFVSTPPGDTPFFKQLRSSSLRTPPESQQLLIFAEPVIGGPELDIRDSNIPLKQAVVSGVS